MHAQAGAHTDTRIHTNTHAQAGAHTDTSTSPRPRMHRQVHVQTQVCTYTQHSELSTPILFMPLIPQMWPRSR